MSDYKSINISEFKSLLQQLSYNVIVTDDYHTCYLRHNLYIEDVYYDSRVAIRISKGKIRVNEDPNMYCYRIQALNNAHQGTERALGTAILYKDDSEYYRFMIGSDIPITFSIEKKESRTNYFYSH